ncbi:MarR family transcriptional regulator [Halorutilales archaeon Cl-col2-1]|nr:MarR family transcriptional regulator [Halobacteria archaeon]
MPIEAERFERLDENPSLPNPETNAGRILSFLRQNPDKAFTQSEIAEATDVKSGSVGPTLVRLREKGRVEHRSKYWRVSDHVQSLDAAVRQSSQVADSHEDDTFDYEDWQEHAVDPRQKQSEER